MKGVSAFLMAVFLLVSCAGGEEKDSAVVYHQGRGQYLFHTVNGTLTTVTINHEEIPGFMEAMAMPFPLASPSLVEGIGAGQDIVFRIAVQQDGTYLVDQIQKVDPPERPR